MKGRTKNNEKGNTASVSQMKNGDDIRFLSPKQYSSISKKGIAMLLKKDLVVVINIHHRIIYW